eukprot:scaffold1281_cov265-Prasinococcus_capsulatus_cf.AAC.2
MPRALSDLLPLAGSRRGAARPARRVRHRGWLLPSAAAAVAACGAQRPQLRGDRCAVEGKPRRRAQRGRELASRPAGACSRGVRRGAPVGARRAAGQLLVHIGLPAYARAPRAAAAPGRAARPAALRRGMCCTAGVCGHARASSGVWPALQDPQLRSHKLLLVIGFALQGGRLLHGGGAADVDADVAPPEAELLTWHLPSRAALALLVRELLAEEGALGGGPRLGECEDDDALQLEGRLGALAGALRGRRLRQCRPAQLHEGAVLRGAVLRRAAGGRAGAAAAAPAPRVATAAPGAVALAA